GRASAIGVSRSQVFVTGTSQNAFGTVALNVSDGSRRWLSRYNGGGRRGRRGDPLGGGAGNLGGNGAPGRGFAPGRCGGHSGLQDLASIVHGPGDSASGARQVALGHQGSLYITGSEGDDLATVDYGAFTGHRRWLRTFPGKGTALVVNQVSGDTIVTGTSSQS